MLSNNSFEKHNAIKLIIFDLDGTLVDSRPLHKEALNAALRQIDEKYIISDEEHAARYDGRSTTVKLEMLTREKGLPKDLHNKVWQLKQDMTNQVILTTIQKDSRIFNILMQLKNKGYKLYCASNSIWNTIKTMLSQLGLLECFDFFISNEEVSKAKPSPEIYLKCIIRCGVTPRETLILEDSDIGKFGALLSGAHLCPIIDPTDLTLEKITSYIKMSEEKNIHEQPKNKALMKNLTVVIPMAGNGSRFANAGYVLPKPLIEVGPEKKPMIQIVVENLNVEAKFIFVVQKAHLEKYNLRELLNKIAPGCEIVITDKVTEGAACTILLAREFINNENPLLFANSDQFVEWNSAAFLYQSQNDNVDGSILTFEATHPKWSFVKLNEDGFVSQVAEKNPISNLATVGIYYWKHGFEFVKYAEQMIAKNIRVNNEFYTVPVYQQAIDDGKKIKSIGCTKMWGIGVPEDLEYFLANYKGEY